MQAEKVGSNSSLYSNTKKMKIFEQKKKGKIKKREAPLCKYF